MAFGRLHVKAQCGHACYELFVALAMALPAVLRTFFLYEVYESEAALQAHSQTDHFRRYVLGDALDRLESRRREVYEVIDEP